MPSLTGRRRYRVGGFFRRRLILQVELAARFPTYPHGEMRDERWWRDAKVEDLMTIEACHRPFPVVAQSEVRA